MRIIVTAGPTREYLDPVRFLSNASSGKMGFAVASAAAAAHQVTLLAGPVGLEAPANCQIERFTSADDLRIALERLFPSCDVLIMSAAVGDFRPMKVSPSKLRRAGGPITLRLIPTEDILAGLGRQKQPGQRIIAFAVEDGSDEEILRKARAEMTAKNSDYTVVNTPAAVGADVSRACILSPSGLVLPWGQRTKEDLAAEIVKLIRV